MAEIDDELVPMDGLTNTAIRFAGFDTMPSTGAALVRFEMLDEDGDRFATFSIEVDARAEGTTDALIAEGHRQMRDVLRQWLYRVDRAYRRYSARTPAEPPQS